MDVVGVTAAYLPMVRVCVLHGASLDCAVRARATHTHEHTHAQTNTQTHARTHTRTHTMGKYAAVTPTMSISTDEIEPLL